MNFTMFQGVTEKIRVEGMKPMKEVYKQWNQCNAAQKRIVLVTAFLSMVIIGLVMKNSFAQPKVSYLIQQSQMKIFSFQKHSFINRSTKDGIN